MIKVLGRGFMTVEFFWETVFRKIKEVQEELSPEAIHSQMSSLRIILMPLW